MSTAQNLTMPEENIQEQTFAKVLSAQKAAFERNRYPALDTRIRRLKILSKLLHSNREKIIQALHEDFGHRSNEETRLAEISSSVGHAEYAISHLRGWMKPRSRSTSIWFLPGGNTITPQPLGVVGIMAPWNYPINLAVAPLVAAIAAGNRAMIKMSEYTPASMLVLKEMLATEFDEDEIAVFGGEAQASAEFSALPFDHLLFTGSTQVGRKVMAAAAENLTPVTLELGGKSPVIVNDDYSLEEAASRILWGKTFNAGQTCVAPDYVMIPKGTTDAFVAAITKLYRLRFPDGALSDDFSAIIDQRNFDRLSALVNSSAAEIMPMECIVTANRVGQRNGQSIYPQAQLSCHSTIDCVRATL